MKIAIDARMMGPMSTRGIGRYTEELVRGMIAVRSNDLHLILLMRDPESSPFIGVANVDHVKADVSWYGAAEQIMMPKLFNACHADLVHIPHWNVPLLYRGPFVSTVHDVLLLRQPASAKASTRHPITAAMKNVGFRLSLDHAVSRGRRIFVPTRFVADEINHFYPKTSSKMIVTGEGITPLPAPDLDRFKVQPWLAKAGPFLFYVGSAYPHKRIDLLLNAWEKMNSRPGLGQERLSLVIAGEEDVFMARHIAFVKEKNLPRVFFLGRVTDAELSGLLQKAHVMVFPSSYEGFGLPPLEALSFGCPVVSSDTACLKEVLPAVSLSNLAKSGVEFFRNGDADDMIRAIDTVVAERSAYAEAARQGIDAIRSRYDWREVARRTIDGYRGSF